MQEMRNFKNGGVPKSWQDKRITRYLRKNYVRKRRKTALAIYLVLTELASDKNGDRFQAYQNTIADMAGVSYSTARKYLAEFIALKLIKKEYVKQDKKNQANFWFLLEYSAMTFACIKNKKQGEQSEALIIKSRCSGENNDEGSVKYKEQD